VRAVVEPFLVQQTGRPVLDRWRLKRLLERPGGRPPDVIHYHNVSLVGGLGVLGMGRALKLYTAHEYWLVCPTHLLFRYNREICERPTCVRCTLRSGRPPQWWRTTRTRDRFVVHLDTIIFPSRLTQSVYEQHGVNRPGRVLHHFLPDSYLETAHTRGTRRADADPYFLYVGRMAAVKGVEPLLKHFATGPSPAPLYLAGDGPLEGALRRRYAGHPAIRFLGRRSQADLGPLYRDALALILPSAGYEIYGQVVLEAFAHGTPAVVTDVTGASEFIEASGAGRVYRSEAELVTALGDLADSSTRDALGRRGREYLRQEHGEKQYVDRYEALIRERRR
jgi:glycosyltransferase involved in cell wall biosynthesis